MGCRNGDFVSDEEKAVSDSLSDLLLFTTMCIIGFPVDVHVKDGSVYSGTFYTACLDHDYAIVLKRARLTKKGNRKANVPNCSLIETLVIQAADLVQVVAKDILLPAEGIPRRGGADDDRALAVVTPQDLCKEGGENNTKRDEFSSVHKYSNCTSLSSRTIEGLVEGSPQGNRSNLSAEPKFQIEQKQIDEVETFRSSVDACDTQPNLSNCNNEEAEEVKISNPSFEKSSGIKTKGTKGFNLNPKAKVFCPSSVMHRPATLPALATLANVTYVPDLLPMVPTASIEPEIDTSSFSHPSYTPAKYLPQNNLVFGSGHVQHQYPQPVRAYVGSRTQPVRYAAHYGHVQPGTAYMHPNSQNVMAGRWEPVVYVHPVSNEVVTHGSIRPPQVPPHAVLTSHSFNIPKHQAATASMQTMQVYMTPTPLIGNNGLQPLTMPSYMTPTMSQVPVMGAFPVPGSDNSFFTKFV